MGRVRPGMAVPSWPREGDVPARAQPGGSACAPAAPGGLPLPLPSAQDLPSPLGWAQAPGMGSSLALHSLTVSFSALSTHARTSAGALGAGTWYPARLRRSCSRFCIQWTREVGVGSKCVCSAASGVAGALLPSPASAHCGFLSALPGCLQTHRLLLSPST